MGLRSWWQRRLQAEPMAQVTADLRVTHEQLAGIGDRLEQALPTIWQRAMALGPNRRVVIEVELGLSVLDPEGHLVHHQSHARSLTYAGMAWGARALCDPTTRPAVAGYIGIGYGVGADTPFDPAQTDLQGASKPRKPATFTFDAPNRAAILEATWGPNDPEPSLIFLREIGLFDAGTGGTLIDRVVITPWPKQPEHTVRAHAVIRLVESAVAYQFV